MRIIDKNKDFYDFYQNIYRDDTFTFDRRDSFILTKEILCNYLEAFTYLSFKNQRFITSLYKPNYLLLQICHTYWLFLINITKVNDYGRVKDYEIQLLANWENINKPRKLCSLEVIDFRYFYSTDRAQIEDYIRDINTNNYRIKREINKHIVYNGDRKVEKHIPLLKACGIGDCIDALKVYLAFEEYFSLEKTSSERREPLNTTDIDKIERHGFDKKTSFRGKQSRNRRKK